MPRRRHSVRSSIVLLALAGMLAAPLAPSGARASEDEPDWRLAVQAWSFRLYTFFEAVDKTASLGVRWIEAYPGQSLRPEDPEARFHHSMSPHQRDLVRRKLSESGVSLANYGVVELPNSEEKCRQVFDFARDMGIETIVSEPTPEAMPLVDRLAREYRIHVALHNHPEPSRYWNPDTVLDAVKQRSEWVGACADTGHWMRSGIAPIEAVRKLGDRIVCFHFKDLGEFGNPEAHDVPWGTGKADAKGILAELRRLGFRGVFSIEYEHNWDKSLPEIARCVEFFRKTSSEIR